VTLQEALSIAALAKPKHRQPLDKLQAGNIAAQLSMGAAALSKRFDAMGGTVADLQKQLDRARAGIERCADAMNVNIKETLQ
jgi:hypothetical protein